MAAAAQLKGQSEATLADYEKALAEARSRAQAIAAEMHQQVTKESEARRDALEAKLNAQLAEAEKAIGETKIRAMTNVRAIAAEATAAIIERLTGSVPSPSSVDAAVNDALRR